MSDMQTTVNVVAAVVDGVAMAALVAVLVITIIHIIATILIIIKSINVAPAIISTNPNSLARPWPRRRHCLRRPAPKTIKMLYIAMHVNKHTGQILLDKPLFDCAL